MKAVFTCAECGQRSPALLVTSDELDATPRHSTVGGRRFLGRAPRDRRGAVALADGARAAYVVIERHVCDGSGRPPAAVVTELGL